MRVLILSAAVLAYAAAAPSVGLLTAVPAAIPAIPLPAAVATISPGDIQAAFIDAKVQAEDQARLIEDQARAAADQARLLADQAKEQAEINAAEIQQKNGEINGEKTGEINDGTNEKTLDALWSAEDKKWQALDALKTAEAKIDGAIARDAPVLAKSAVGVVGVVPPVFAAVPSPVVAPLVPSPIVYATPGFLAPLVKAAEEPKTENAKEKDDAAVVKTAEITEEKKTETESIAKSSELINQAFDKAVLAALGQPSVLAPLQLTPTLKIGNPWLATPLAYYQPGAAFTSSTIQQIQEPYGATVIRTQW